MALRTLHPKPGYNCLLQELPLFNVKKKTKFILIAQILCELLSIVEKRNRVPSYHNSTINSMNNENALLNIFLHGQIPP